jgi:type IV secretory pathway VirB4 component
MAEAPATTKIVPLKDITEHIIFLKDDSLRSVLEVSAINFELRSTDEQIALIQQFQGFLNSIDFTLQIVMQSRKYNIEEYLSTLRTTAGDLTNEMLKVQAEEYIRFVRELSDLANIMKKKFYVVIPLEVVRGAGKEGLLEGLRGLFSRKKKETKESGPTEDELQAWRMQLGQRADLVSAGLASMGLKSRLLEQPELFELFSALYNPVVPANPEQQTSSQTS